MGLAALMPKEYTVEQIIEIHASPEIVFPLVADFSKWKEWSPWYEYEPNANYEINGSVGKIESSLKWHGGGVGRGVVLLTDIEDLKKITMNFNFETPHESEAIGIFTFKRHENSTIVSWTNHGELEYPMGRIFARFLKTMIEKDLNKGLQKLKTRAETSAQINFQENK